MANQHAKYLVHLDCSALDPDTLVVDRMIGREEISRLFVFDVWVRSTAEPLFLEDFDEIMGGTATLSFGPDREHPIHGVVRDIELLPTDDIGRVVYRLRVVPRLWDTQLTVGSWIYQEKTPQQILTSALGEILPEGARLTSGEQFDVSLESQYLPREYVVQYEESIFNFVSRQAEHWGIFYYFDHLGEEEKAVFCDMNTAFPQLEGHETIQFAARTGGTDPEEVIYAISARQRMISHNVSLRDYNYRIPSVSLVTPLVEADPSGIGDVHSTGDHFWTPDEGSMLASVRAEELYARKRLMRATSRVRGLRAGHRFTMEGGTPEILGLARDYIVVAVEHDYGGGGGDDTMPYRNHLTLLPAEVAFRPARTTPKPRIHGLMHAKVDSEASDDGIRVPVDEWGRYKVVMPFDVAGKKGGKSSCWMRLATSAGGSGWGFAQGLHVDTEVVIGHIDGDPDRPVIAGSVMNFEQPAVVTRENANQSVVSSRQGIVMKFSDA